MSAVAIKASIGIAALSANATCPGTQKTNELAIAQNARRLGVKRPSLAASWSSAPVKYPLENPIKQGGFEADKYGRIVARTLRPSAFHCATVPDGPGCKWEGGSFARIEAKNRAALKSHIGTLRAAEEAEIEVNGYFSEPDWRDAVSPDGVRCVVTLKECPNALKDMVERRALKIVLRVSTFMCHSSRGI